MPEKTDAEIEELQEWLRDHPNALPEAVSEVQERLRILTESKNQKEE